MPHYHASERHKNTPLQKHENGKKLEPQQHHVLGLGDPLSASRAVAAAAARVTTVAARRTLWIPTLERF